MALVAEGFAFAIGSASAFAIVENAYFGQCPQLGTCRGCEWPLRSWTQCVTYPVVAV